MMRGERKPLCSREGKARFTLTIVVMILLLTIIIPTEVLAATYSVKVISNQCSASVYMDGSYRGTTSKYWPWDPCSYTVTGVSYGPHTFKVSKTGYNSESLQKYVTSNTEITINIYNTPPSFGVPYTSPGSPTTLDTIAILATITDNSVVTKAEAHYKKPGDWLESSATMWRYSGNIWKATIGTSGRGDLSFHVWAKDDVGDTSESVGAIQFVKDGTAPYIAGGEITNSPTSPNADNDVEIRAGTINDPDSGISTVVLWYMLPGYGSYMSKAMPADPSWLDSDDYKTTVYSYEFSQAGYLYYFVKAYNGDGISSSSSTKSAYISWPTYDVAVYTSPASASVSVDGVYKGVTSWDWWEGRYKLTVPSVARGTHSFKAVAYGYLDASTSEYICVSDKTVSLSLTNPPPTISTPQLHPAAPTNADYITVSVTITDNSWVNSATLTYKRSGDLWDTSTSMTRVSGTWWGDIGVSPRGSLEYAVTAVDDMGASSTSQRYSTSVKDSSAPYIDEDGVGYRPSDLGFELRDDLGIIVRAWTVNDPESGIAEVKLWYQIGSKPYASLVMEPDSLSIWDWDDYVVTIPSSELTGGGRIYLYLWATNGDGLSTRAPSNPSNVYYADISKILIGTNVWAEIHIDDDDLVGWIRTAGSYAKHAYQYYHSLGFKDPKTESDRDVDIYIIDIPDPTVLGDTDGTGRIRIDTVNLGDDEAHRLKFEGTVAHEFMHVVELSYDWNPVQFNFIDEGLAEWGAIGTLLSQGFSYDYIFQYYPHKPSDFTNSPDKNIFTEWTGDPGQIYIGAYLFNKYLADRFDGANTLIDVEDRVAAGDTGLTAVDNAVPPTFTELFLEWTLWNYADGLYDPQDTAHMYRGIAVRTALSEDIQFTGDQVSLPPISGSLSPWAADYIKVKSSVTRIDVAVTGLDGSLSVRAILVCEYLSDCGGDRYKIQDIVGNPTILNADSFNDIVLVIARRSDSSVTYSVTLSTLPPDLTVSSSSISFSDDTPDVGDDIGITAVITNSGIAKGTATIRFYDGDPWPGGTLIGYKVVSVKGGKSAPAAVSWSLFGVGGPHRVYVRIEDSNPSDSDPSNNQAYRDVVIGLTFRFSSGRNMISFPLITWTSYTASSFASEIAGGGGAVTKIECYDVATDTYLTYIPGVSGPEDDFPMISDVGYNIYTAGNANLRITGDAPGSRSVSLFSGWNLIGFTELKSIKASQLASRIGSLCDAIDWYNPATGGYESYLPGVSGPEYDFTIRPGYGLLVYMEGSSTLVYN